MLTPPKAASAVPYPFLTSVMPMSNVLAPASTARTTPRKRTTASPPPTPSSTSMRVASMTPLAVISPWTSMKLASGMSAA